MGNIIREPIQKRSIEKKEKIIKSGFELICNNGYYNTNTAQIAKNAGVSTGIVYQYFKDKHDILVEGIKLYGDSIFFPVIYIPKNIIEKDELKNILKNIIVLFKKNHKLSKIAHEEITSMIHSDEEIASLYYESELKITEKLTQIFINSGFNTDNLVEKAHIILHLIDDLCHEIIYHNHDNMNYDKMTDIIINTITKILK